MLQRNQYARLRARTGGCWELPQGHLASSVCPHNRPCATPHTFPCWGVSHDSW
ncbi:hypothetical protein HMPREF9154_3037 [Arachnia propionica F0230a]|nr:hypothetical protein HMPREF9154_3037 [Arachnia propionica F0230a]